MFSSNEFVQIKLSEGGWAETVDGNNDTETNEYRYNLFTFHFIQLKGILECFKISGLHLFR